MHRPLFIFLQKKAVPTGRRINDDNYFMLYENDGNLMLHRVKKQNDINKGKWTGVGGHAEDQESPEIILREVKEETGLTLTSLQISWPGNLYKETANVNLSLCVYLQPMDIRRTD